MNFSISAIIKWFHDAIFGHEERIAALEARAGVTPAVAPTPPAPPEVAAHVAAAASIEVLPLSVGVVGTNGVKALWKDYAGQVDRVAFPAISIRIGRALTDAEAAAAYTGGIVKLQPLDANQPAGDHSGFDLGVVPSGDYRRNSLDGGKRYTFSFKVEKEQRLRFIVAPEATMGKGAFDLITLQLRRNGEVVEDISHQANTGANYITFKDAFQPAAYEIDVTLDKSELVAVQFGWLA